jgi:hypothetical protein
LLAVFHCMSCLLRCISACCWLPYVLDCETRARRPGIFLDVSTCRNRFNWLMPRPKERKEEFPRGSLQLNSHDGMASQPSPTPCQIRPGSFVEYDFRLQSNPRPSLVYWARNEGHVLYNSRSPDPCPSIRPSDAIPRGGLSSNPNVLSLRTVSPSLFLFIGMVTLKTS